MIQNPTAADWQRTFPGWQPYPTSLTHARAIRDGLIAELIDRLKYYKSQSVLTEWLDQYCINGGADYPEGLARVLVKIPDVEMFSCDHVLKQLRMVAGWIYWQERRACLV